jgi:hypothetical protein
VFVVLVSGCSGSTTSANDAARSGDGGSASVDAGSDGGDVADTGSTDTDAGDLVDAAVPDVDGGGSLTSCGGRGGGTCAADEWCDYEGAVPCGAADGTGVCRARPANCAAGTTVCGCDGNPYPSACAAEQAGTDVTDTLVCLTP